MGEEKETPLSEKQKNRPVNDWSYSFLQLPGSDANT